MKLINYNTTIEGYSQFVIYYLMRYDYVKSYDKELKSLFVTDNENDLSTKIYPFNKVIMVLMIEYFYSLKDKYPEIAKTKKDIATELVYHLNDIGKTIYDIGKTKIQGLVDESIYSKILVEDSNFTEKDKKIFEETLQIFQDYLGEYLEENKSTNKSGDELSVSNLLQRKEKLLSKVNKLRDKDFMNILSNDSSKETKKLLGDFKEILELYLDNHIVTQLKNEKMTEQDKIILCLYLYKIVRAFETSPKNNWKYMLKNGTTYSRENLEQKLKRIEGDVTLYNELFESAFYSQLLKNWMDK